MQAVEFVVSGTSCTQACTSPPTVTQMNLGYSQIGNDAEFTEVVLPSTVCNFQGDRVMELGELMNGGTASDVFDLNQVDTLDLVPASTITDREQAVLQYNRQVLEAHARAVASDNDAIARAPPRLRPLRPRRALPQAELVGSSPALVKQAWWPWRPEDAPEVWIDEEGPCLEAVM